MTENEVNETIETLENMKFVGDDAAQLLKIFATINIAIIAVREVQEYRKLGTVEEIRRLKSNNCWIPCSERLPDPGTKVICCFDNGELDMMWQNWKSRGKNGLIYSDIDGRTLKVVAWRPLPDPYRPEQIGVIKNDRNNLY